MDKKIKKFLKKIWWFMFSLLTLVGGILTGFPVCNNNYVYVTANDTPTEHICRRRVSQNPKECNTCSTASEKEPITMSFNIKIVREYLIDASQYAKNDNEKNESRKTIIDYVCDYISEGLLLILSDIIGLMILIVCKLILLKRKICNKIFDDVVTSVVEEIIEEEKDGMKEELKKWLKNQSKK